jgi:hypothetical protein|eukprot:COSAG01_NODE_4086_length_5369_cov_30.431499_5_plen_82_part_00
MPLSWIHPGSRYRNGSPPGDHRKPVSKAFEEYWLRIYCPIMFAALFGAEGYRRGAHACVRACVRLCADPWAPLKRQRGGAG